MEFGNIFGSIMASKVMSGYATRLPLGRHLVLIKRFAPKRAEMSGDTIIELDVLVAQTNSQEIREGDTRGWAWFPNSKGLAAQYESGRSKEFIEKVLRSCDTRVLPPPEPTYYVPGQPQPVVRPLDPETGKPMHDVASIGGHLVAGTYRGLQLWVDISPALKKDGTQRTTNKGEKINNADWTIVSGQSFESLAATCAALGDQLAPPEAAPAPQQAAHTQQTQQGGYAGHGGSGMGNFVGQAPAQNQYPGTYQQQPPQAPPQQNQQNQWPPQFQQQPPQAPPAAAPPPAQAPAAGGPLSGILAGLKRG